MTDKGGGGDNEDLYSRKKVSRAYAPVPLGAAGGTLGDRLW